MFRYLVTIMALIVLPATLSHALQLRTITDMGGRTVRIPVTIRKVYAIGHCLPMVSAVAPEKVLNSFKLSDAAKRFLPKSYYQGKVVPWRASAPRMRKSLECDLTS